MINLQWGPHKGVNGAAFAVGLTSYFQEAFKASSLTEEILQNIIINMSPTWLEGHGYDKELYRRSIRVTWSEEWCIKSVTVPGNACGLDLSDRSCGDEERILVPHNIDTIIQASLLLTVVSKIVDYIAVENRHAELMKK